jgi:hypothetical protein
VSVAREAASGAEVAVGEAETRLEAVEDRPALRRPKRRWFDLGMSIYVKLLIVYLLVPIAVMVLYSFNANPATATAAAP